MLSLTREAEERISITPTWKQSIS